MALAIGTTVKSPIGTGAGGWGTTTTPKTLTVTSVTGELLVVWVMAESNDNTFTLPPSGNLKTFTQKLSNASGGASHGAEYVWAVTENAGATGWALSQSAGGALDFWGIGMTRFTGANGTGAVSQTANGTSPNFATASLTTTAANSGLLCFAVDWTATAPTGRTYSTINGITPVAGGAGEIIADQETGQYTVYGVYYSDAGAIGSKSFTITGVSPGGNTVSMIEIVPVASSVAAPAPHPRLFIPQLAAADRSARW